MKYPTLKRIEVITPDSRWTKYGKKHWKLLDFYHARFHTDEGVFDLKLYPGNITDFRSGSDSINWFVPKIGNNEYKACVLGHDTAYSGWISKGLADHLFIKQGFNVSKQVSSIKSNIAYGFVATIGTAYDMNEQMPFPYTNNRKFESLKLEAK